MKIKKIFLNILISFIIIPINVYAYSNKVILGGNNIGIEVKTNGILVVGLYEIDGKLPAQSSGIQAGDYIINVNNKTVKTISDFTNEINNDDDKLKIDVTYKRNNKEYKTKLELVKKDNEYKTGLYVKDKINGIGTLTFIDPNTKKFGALGHEIVSKETGEILKIDDGFIYYSYITGITKSNNGSPGEKDADYDKEKKYGTITKNTNKGIFGDYTDKINNENVYEVATNDEIKEGKANLFTVIDGENLESFEVQIEKLNFNENTKNIVFKITDKKLLNSTGGIVQGMSGSPIIQNNKIIGAVTHVIVNDPTKGHGIFISNMLKESDD